MLRSTKTLALTILMLTLGAQAHETTSQARYLGNEGILVTHGDVKVLFDAFYESSYDRYVLVADQTEARLLAGESPFDGVDALFVSHVHGDHFTAEPTLAYLRAQPQVQFYASRQVIDELIKRIEDQADPVLSRLNSFDIQPGDPAATATLDGIQIEVVAIPHSGGARMEAVANLAFRVTLHEAATVLHMGDADVDDKHFAPLQTFWDSRTTHTAYPPYWFFSNATGESILTNRIKALHSIGIHVPAEATGNGEVWRQQAGGDLFTDPGEVRDIPTAPD